MVSQDEGASELRGRLAVLIEQAAKRRGGYSALAQAIKQCNGAFAKGRVERRKLSLIARQQDVSLTPDELQALDTYLSQEGKGLGDVFAKASIIRSLVEREEVVFLLGSRPCDERQAIELSGWDFRAMSEILRRTYQTTASIRVNIEEVFLYSQDELAEGPYEERFSGERWWNLLANANGPSLVCIGSPRSCHATELMLASMLGVRPFERLELQGAAPAADLLPFLFVWSREQYEALPSAFALNESAIPVHPESKSALKWKTLGLWAEGQWHQVHRVGRSWSTYGVVAAQRRRTGQIWLVVTGLNGPGTLASAKMIDAITVAVPQNEARKHGPVLWAVVEGNVVEAPRRHGDKRDLTGQRLCSDAAIWAKSSINKSVPEHGVFSE